MIFNKYDAVCSDLDDPEEPELLPEELEPVSYTHLDVYKRQVYRSLFCLSVEKERFGYGS